MNAGIYCIENIFNNKIYIGQSKSLEKRLSNQKMLLRKDLHPNIHLQNSFNKFGDENFSFRILEKTDNLKSLNKLENKWIDHYKSFAGKNGYNIKYPTKVFRISYISPFRKICAICEKLFIAERSNAKYCSKYCRELKWHPKNKVRKFRFHRICQLKECIIEFDTNRKDHFFCDTVHQQEWWKRERRKESSLASELSKQRLEIEDLKDDVKKLKQQES